MEKKDIITMTPEETVIAEEFQRECHDLIDYILKEAKTVEYQDAMAVWVFKRLANIEARIRKMEGTITDDK